MTGVVGLVFGLFALFNSFDYLISEILPSSPANLSLVGVQFAGDGFKPSPLDRQFQMRLVFLLVWSAFRVDTTHHSLDVLKSYYQGVVTIQQTILLRAMRLRKFH